VRRHWWLGWERTDPEGFRCRVGALWARLLLKKGWALTAGQTVWVRDPRTWRRYLRNEFWRAHEHHHVWQERHRFPNTLAYLSAFVWQYVRYRSHDAAPLEIEADEAARVALSVRRPEGQDT
jgi:hypothetical protein